MIQTSKHIVCIIETNLPVGNIMLGPGTKSEVMKARDVWLEALHSIALPVAADGTRIQTHCKIYTVGAQPILSATQRGREWIYSNYVQPWMSK